MIIGVSALVTIAAGTTIGFVACNGDKAEDATAGVSTSVRSETYSLEIGTSSEVSAMDLYKELLHAHSSLGVLSTESSATVITQSNADSMVEVSFSDGSSKKSFTSEGTFEETLIIRNKTTKGVSELVVTLTVKKSAVTTATTVSTTKATTTTSVTTTTTVKTTKKATKPKKKEENKSDNKTEVKDDNNTAYEDDNNYEYDESQYEEPAQQETPKQDTPAPAPDPEPAPEPEPPAGGLAGEWGWSGYEADLFNYALNQGCADWQADQYVWYVKTNGRENVFIGNPNPDDPNNHWGIWYHEPGSDTYTYG